MQQGRDNLKVGEKLHNGDRIISKNGQFYAELLQGGNFVVFSSNPVDALWATNTINGGYSHIIVQNDGNLVLYNPIIKGRNKFPKWASNTWGRDNNPRLVMQDDGNLVLFSSQNETLWESGTVGGKKVMH